MCVCEPGISESVNTVDSISHSTTFPSNLILSNVNLTHYRLYTSTHTYEGHNFLCDTVLVLFRHLSIQGQFRNRKYRASKKPHSSLGKISQRIAINLARPGTVHGVLHRDTYARSYMIPNNNNNRLTIRPAKTSIPRGQMATLTVGVLALQGGVAEHLSLLKRAAPEVSSDNHSFQFIQVRTTPELARCDALIIPGGESTTMSIVAKRLGLLEPLREFVK